MTPLLTSIIKLAENQEASDFSYLWAGLSALAARVADNVYIPFGNSNIYPNLYVMLVGDPGKRKSTAIKDLKKRVKSSGVIGLCGDKVTMQKYLTDLAGISDEQITRTEDGDFSFDLGGMSSTSTPSYICQDEFSDFIGINNYPFISLLGNFWDIDEDYSYKTKGGAPINIPVPRVNILGATTPSQFNTIFPPAIAEQGFLSRLIIVNVPDNKQKLSRPLPSDPDTIAEVIEGFITASSLKGEMIVSDEVWQYLDDIYMSWQPLEDSRFAHYSTRRHTQLIKLVILMAVSRNSVEVNTNDVIMANTLLSYTEHLMPTALGAFGKQRDSDVSHKIMEILHKSFPHEKIHVDIYRSVAMDISVNEFHNLLKSLIASGKIVQTDTGLYAKQQHISSINTAHVHWQVLKNFIPSLKF